MPIISALFWVLGLILSITIAPQLRIWSWGPSMLCFAISTIFALPSYWKKRNSCTDLVLLVIGFILAAWIAIRAITTPVPEAALSDGLLLAMAVSAFMCFRPITSHRIANNLLIFGLAAALLASVVVIGRQVIDPMFSPIFPNDERRLPAGFFAHYSYGASFLIPTALLLAAVALYSDKNLLWRLILLTVALAGCVAVFFTKSRGGFVGIGAGVVAFLILGTIASGSNKRAFAFHIVAIPLLLIAFTGVFYSGLLDIQDQRGKAGMSFLMDNSIRLYLLNIAYSCISLHPWIGGGSRSYSWECYRFWDSDAMGKAFAKPEHVHNEFVQTASDYGLIGLALLLAFMISVIVTGLLILLKTKQQTDGKNLNYWIVGGIAGFVGLFAQSNFEGVLRLPTGAIMLGFTFAAASITPFKELPRSITTLLPRMLVTFSVLLAVTYMINYGWKGSLVSRTLWPTYFSKSPVETTTRLEAFNAAINIWPIGSLIEERAHILHQLANQHNDDALKVMAIADYERAASMHPYHPEPTINAAILFSSLGDDKRAEEYFLRSVALQWRMESIFLANREFAEHLLNKAYRESTTDGFVTSLKTLELATKHVNLMAEIQASWFNDGNERQLYTNVRESYARALEQAGDTVKALEIYDQNSQLPWGRSSNYFAGVLIDRKAAARWQEGRNEDALALYIRALDRMKLAGRPPEGITHEVKAKYEEYLQRMIDYLKNAKIIPSENPEF